MSQSNLVIVESPAKAKTIQRILGKNFKVASSIGHIADLPKKELGIDVENGFEPKYVVSRDKAKIVRELKKLADQSKAVWLASDDDREGEAIAWHLFQRLKLKEQNTKRITFSEITKKAITRAIENPKQINGALVEAQKARRVLDRIVGYELSPLLWRKVKRGLSAGRVQSVATRLIVEREREIEKFVPKHFYRIEGQFKTNQGNTLKAYYSDEVINKERVIELFQKSQESQFKVSNLEVKPGKKSPPAPFTTSTLQQEASRKLGFPVSKTMRVAQSLYEQGDITYMRTDSPELSSESQYNILKKVESSYGKSYAQARNFKVRNKTAQQAHEAIRPTSIEKKELDGQDIDQTRLYRLIWNRTIASQMSNAKIEKTKIELRNEKHDIRFIAQGEVIKFDGFLKVYQPSEKKQENTQTQEILPIVSVDDKLEMMELKATQKMTPAPYRFTEASLVRQLEEMGIGRPSTYAPIISIIQKRNYVEVGQSKGEKKFIEMIRLKNGEINTSLESEFKGATKGKLIPTDVGAIVNDFLVQNFEEVLDYQFTAQVEKSFDDIALGNTKWVEVIEKFYEEFHPTVAGVTANARKEAGDRELGIDPKTKRIVKVRLGRFGPMVQLGDVTDEEKQVFVGLPEGLKIANVTFEQALELLSLPRNVGPYNNQDVVANQGRYGPYLMYEKKYFSIPSKRGITPFNVTLEQAIEIIEDKKKQDVSLLDYDGFPVTKGKGRFGPFLKWNNSYISIPKEIDFGSINKDQIVSLIEKKIEDDKKKIIKEWKEQGIRINRARWGTSVIVKGTKKVRLPKEIDPTELSLEDVKKYLKPKTRKKANSKL